MPPSRVWGKRERSDSTASGTGRQASAAVHFSDLSPEEKVQRRAEERKEKKERDRTMAYFTAAQQQLKQQEQESGAAALKVGDGSSVEGFFIDLYQRLRDDPSSVLLRNRVICETVELAIRQSTLLQSKTLLFVLLGRMPAMFSSPVASYIIETVLRRLSELLSHMAVSSSVAEEEDSLAAEMQEGGQGIHSGVPSTATLLTHVVEEVEEGALQMITDEPASRCLRSLIFMLGGHSVHGGPAPHSVVQFPALLSSLSQTLVTAIEQHYYETFQTGNAAETWMAAAQAPPTSIILQGILRVSGGDAGAGGAASAFRHQLETLTLSSPGRNGGSRSLLEELLQDRMGFHLVESYLRIPTPESLVEGGASEAMRQFSSSNNNITESEETKSQLLDCPWGRVLEMATAHVAGWLTTGGEDWIQHCRFVLQDLALYAPSPMHLYYVWQMILKPHLSIICEDRVLLHALVHFVRKAALDGSEADSSSGELRAEDAEEAKRVSREKAAGVPFFTVPVRCQQLFCEEICQSVKAQQQQVGEKVVRLYPKGAAEAFLVRGLSGSSGSAPVQELGDEVDGGRKAGTNSMVLACGADVARYLFRFHHTACVWLQHSVEKLRVEDVDAAARDAKGSRAMQCYLQAISFSHPPAAAASTGTSAPAEGSSEPPAEAAVQKEKSPTSRLFRRVTPYIRQWAQHTYAAYVLEQLYRVSSLAVKECIVKDLVPLRQQMTESRRTRRSRQAFSTATAAVGAVVTETDAEKEARLNEFILEKVMTKCSVELYAHRPEEWRKQAKRQQQIHTLMGKMVYH